MDMVSLGTTPIHPDQPAGADARYEPEFDRLQAEIDKLTSPSASSGVDWKKVNALSSGILKDKSKDILVAGYLAVSQIYCARVEGFLKGVHIYRDVIEHFWDDLFPSKKRMRGRIGAIQWWVEKTEIALKQLDKGAFSPEQMQDSLESLDTIDSLLKGYLEDSPSISAVKRSLEGFTIKAEGNPEPAKEIQQQVQEPQPEPIPAPKSEQPQPPQRTEGIESEKDAWRVLRSGLQELRKVAAYFLETSPENALTYRCSRTAAWSSVEATPPSENNKTRIPPPDPKIMKILHDLHAKGDWEALLKSAERRLNQFIFCLDLNRFVALSLENMGGRYRSAHDAVCQETAFFVDRLSGLTDLTFSDGTPFADQNTRDWLRLISLGGTGVGIEPAPMQTSTHGPGEDEMAEKINHAKTLAGKNNLLEAVEAIQEELIRSVSQKERMLWRLALSEILLSAKKLETALPHLEELRHTIELYRLEEWEPALALRALSMVWRGFSMHPSDVSQNTSIDALNRIAKLSPKQALLLVKK